MTGCFHVWMWCGVLTFPLLIDPTGHEDKCNILLFHPLASSLLTSAACDGTVLIWDLEKKAVKITLDPHPEPVSGVCVCVCACVRACMHVCAYVHIMFVVMRNPFTACGSCLQWPGVMMASCWPLFVKTRRFASIIRVNLHPQPM